MNVIGNVVFSEWPTWWKNFVYSERALENIVNVIVLWLILRVNYNKYICLCGCCHKCIGKCCFKNMDTINMVDNPYEDMELRDNSRTDTLDLVIN